MTVIVSINGMSCWESVEVADTFWRRLVGLLSTNELSSDSGLLLTRCHQIHTFGMRYPIDVVFINHQGQVSTVVSRLSPYRVSTDSSASMALELRAGQAEQAGLSQGDRVTMEAVC